ncbi:RNA-splicing ligase RtcB [Methylorubrum populi]|uniref:RNA-splicing ligase RtcB n=1 Tax=Methylorubrum populi TaxID=223967 RepID=A0A160PFR7_9HYPH|nr:RNA-splicing ligase RtcB [Methylorubrum populi]
MPLEPHAFRTVGIMPDARRPDNVGVGARFDFHRTSVPADMGSGTGLFDILPALEGGDSYRVSGREGRTRLGGFLGRRPNGRSLSAG